MVGFSMSVLIPTGCRLLAYIGLLLVFLSE